MTDEEWRAEETRERDLQVHEPQPIPRQTLRDFCMLPPQYGHCNGSFPRVYYDSPTNECKLFQYGGCGGNKNRFLSFAICHESCSAHRLTVRRMKVMSGIRVYGIEQGPSTTPSPSTAAPIATLILAPRSEGEPMMIKKRRRIIPGFNHPVFPDAPPAPVPASGPPQDDPRDFSNTVWSGDVVYSPDKVN